MDSMSLLNKVLGNVPVTHEMTAPCVKPMTHRTSDDTLGIGRLIALEMSTNRCIPKDLEQLFNRAVTLGNKYTVSRVAEAIERALTTPQLERGGGPCLSV